MTVIAHAGHWIEGGIFAAPVIIVAGALGGLVGAGEAAATA